MSDSQVIARKFRPQAFDQVIGQEAITRTLRNAITSGRLHHAYLFTGARGVGKTTTARILAKALNCANGVTVEPCGVCPSCREIAASSSLDVHEIDAASHTGIDDVREVIISTVQISPARDRYKIFIIDEVHQLSNHAFNALLKTLEEPPPHIVFIMATTELHKVPETILSRCQIFEFRTITTKSIFGQLKQIAADLRIEIGDGALLAIARAGEGSMRDAESALDQVISFAGNVVADEDVSAALGLVDVETLGKLTRAIVEQDAEQVFRLVDDVVSRGYELRNLCREMMVFMRALLVVKSVGFDAELVQMPAEQGESLVRLAESFSEQDLIRFFSILVKTEQDIRISSQPRFHLEIGLMKLVQASRLYLIEDALSRLADLQSRLGVSGATLSAPSAVPQRLTPGEGGLPGRRAVSAPAPVSPTGRTAPAPRPAGSPTRIPTGEPPTRSDSGSRTSSGDGAPTHQGIERGFPAGSSLVEPPEEPPTLLEEPYRMAPEPPSAGSRTTHSNTGGQPDAEKILGMLGARGKMMLLSALDHADSIRVEGDSLLVSYSPSGAMFKSKVEARDARKSLEELSREVLGRTIVLSVTIDDPLQPSVSAKKLETADEREQAEKHPAVRSVVDRFHGEVIEVIKPD
jgi:DNA polymerase III subunit gamma/tau